MLSEKVLMVTSSQIEGCGHEIHLFMSEKTDTQKRGDVPKVTESKRPANDCIALEILVLPRLSLG